MSHIKNLFNRNRACSVIILITIVSALILFIFPPRINVTMPTAQSQIVPAKIMEPDTVYSQKFTSQVESLKRIEIHFATYEIKNTAGSINIQLKSEKGRIIVDKTIPLTELPDNTIYQLKFNELPDSKNTNYELSIKYEDYQEGNSLCFFTAEGGTPYTENDQQSSNHSIVMDEVGKVRDYSFVWWALLFIATSVAIIAVTPAQAKKGQRQ